METSQVLPSQIAITPTHPLLLLAAASVTLFSLAGVGVLAGWLPGPGMHNAAPIQVTTAPVAAPAAVRRKTTAPQEEPVSLAEPVESLPVSVQRNAPAPVKEATATAGSRQEASFGVSPAPTYAAASPEPAYRVATPTPAICSECGVVETVREIAVEAKGSGGGAIAGGLLGGLIANQIGKSSGRSIATVLGAAGGAFAGNYVEKMLREGKRYEVVVRFEDGSTRSFGSETLPAWQSGDPVRLQNGLLTMGGGKSKGNPEMI